MRDHLKFRKIILSNKKKLNVDDAYSLKTPSDSIRFYDEWAETYDSEFVQASGYVVYQRVAALLLRKRSLIHGPVLDVQICCM